MVYNGGQAFGYKYLKFLLASFQEVYVSSTKKQKMAISRSIVEAVRSLDPPGRFLEKNPDSGLWSDIGHKKAVEKTSQALRDGAANLRKQLSADLGDPEFLNVVFDMDVDEDVTKSISIPTSQQRASKGKAIEKAKEKGKENKSRSSDKSKASKVRHGWKLGHENARRSHFLLLLPDKADCSKKGTPQGEFQPQQWEYI